MSETIFLTKEGYQQYLERIKRAEQELQKIRSIRSKEEVQHETDWSDNVSFESSMMQERIALDNLATLKAGLKNIQIIAPEEANDSVNINSVVTIELNVDGEIETLKVRLVAAAVENVEVETSINYPLGQAIYKKKVNDEVTYKVRDSKIRARIMKIE